MVGGGHGPTYETEMTTKGTNYTKGRKCKS